MSHKIPLVRVLTAATGNSTPITLGAAYSQLFMTPAEAGAMDGRTYTYLIVDGNNWEMGRGVYTSTGTTLGRTTVLASRISGTLGTARISLSGTAQVRIVETADDMDGVRGTRPVTTTTDTLNNSDLGYVVTYSNASAIAVSLAQASVSNLFTDGWAVWVKNKGAGTVTITPATSTIEGAATLVLLTGQSAHIWSDGTNYQAVKIGAALVVGSAAIHAEDDFVRTDASQSLSATRRGQAAANLQFVASPQGRLTLTSGVPIMTSTAAGQTTVYYTPSIGEVVPLYDGTNIIPTAFSELSQLTTDATKSPAAVAASKNYDMFVWNDSGTLRCTRGPTWNAGAVAGSDIARGTGAGSTELIRVRGLLFNKNVITNGPTAQRGLYVGTIRSNASSTIDWILGASGTAGVLNVWNAYNRVPVTNTVTDSTGSWNYTSGTVRQANGSAINQVSFVSGLASEGILVSSFGGASLPAAAGAFFQVGFAMDSITAFDKNNVFQNGVAAAVTGGAAQSAMYAPQIGAHYVANLERGDGGNVASFVGGTRMGLSVQVTM